MPRTPRIAPGGMIFHVLNRGNGHAQIFSHDGDYDAFERIMEEVRGYTPMRIISYSLMPTHWHFVLWPEEDDEMAAFMHRLTVTHVRRWHAHHGSGGRGHLYQGGYKSFPVQSDGHLLTVCRYVERNPLRAGLAARAEEWPWGSLSHRCRNDERARKLLCEWPVERNEDYLEWVNQPQTQEEQDALRKCIFRGCPFGEKNWQEVTAQRLGLESAFRTRGRPRKM
ncbi:MAG: transposase [Planctomycetota bacterium]